jgi:hypothetical protein
LTIIDFLTLLLKAEPKEPLTRLAPPAPEAAVEATFDINNYKGLFEFIQFKQI